MEAVGELFEAVTARARDAAAELRDMREKRNGIRAQLAECSVVTKQLDALQSRVAELRQHFDGASASARSYADWKREEKTTEWVEVATPHHNTLCQTHLTQRGPCHEECQLDFVARSANGLTPEHHAAHFLRCACLKTHARCEACGCGPSSHFHARVKYEARTRSVFSILEDMRSQHEGKTEEARVAGVALTDAQQDAAVVQSAIAANQLRLRELCEGLKSQCKYFNFVDEVEAVLHAMEADASTHRDASVRLEARARVRELRLLFTALSAQAAAGAAPALAPPTGAGDAVLGDGRRNAPPPPPLAATQSKRQQHDTPLEADFTRCIVS